MIHHAVKFALVMLLVTGLVTVIFEVIDWFRRH
jgi:hypothetical protein